MSTFAIPADRHLTATDRRYLRALWEDGRPVVSAASPRRRYCLTRTGPTAGVLTIRWREDRGSGLADRVSRVPVTVR